jgi:regulator of cell morphogenesis and NO signaling
MKPTVKDIVLNNYRAADVFKKWGINYCCGGNHSLEEVCKIQNLDKNAIDKELEKAAKKITISNNMDFSEWPIDFLIDYIKYVHHGYIYNNIPALTQSLDSFVNGHRKKYPYLVDVQEAFSILSAELIDHNKKEEENIFPYLKQINNTYNRKESYGSLFVRTLSRSLETTIEREHLRLDSLIKQLRKVTNNYIFKQDACTNHQVIYHKLKELDDDMLQHKYLENSILFPRIIAMEKELLQL